MADDVGIYLKSQGIPAGGETPGAGIFLNPQGNLDPDSFSNWFQGLVPTDQSAVAAAIANMQKQDAQPGAPGGPSAPGDNQVPATGGGTTSGLTDNSPTVDNSGLNTGGGTNTNGTSGGGTPPSTGTTGTPPLTNPPNPNPANTNQGPLNPAVPFVSTDQLPGVPGSPVQPGGPTGGGNFTGIPAAGNTAGPGTQVQLGNNPPVTPGPGAPNASAAASNLGVSGFTPQQLQSLAVMQQMLAGSGGVGGGVGFG